MVPKKMTNITVTNKYLGTVLGTVSGTLAFLINEISCLDNLLLIFDPA